MSRDRASRDRARALHEPAGRDQAADRDRALLGAYVDGVAELTQDERRAAESLVASDPAARTEADAMRGLIDQLRALPPDGDEPDWSKMERAIRQAVADEPIRPWWRRWRWWAPTLTCATAAVVLVAVWPAITTTATPPPSSAAYEPRLDRAPRAPSEGDAAAAEAIVPLWLDGSEIEVDVAAAGGELGGLLGDPDDDLDVVASEPQGSDVPGDLPDGAGRDDAGLLPASDLAWVDRLDDDALARAESWLSGSKG